MTYKQIAMEIKEALSVTETPIDRQRIEALAHKLFVEAPLGFDPITTLENVGCVAIVTNRSENWAPISWALQLPNGRGWYYYNGNPLYDTKE